MQGQEYIVVGGTKEKLGVMVSRMSPKLLYKMIRKNKSEIKKDFAVLN